MLLLLLMMMLMLVVVMMTTMMLILMMMTMTMTTMMLMLMMILLMMLLMMILDMCILSHKTQCSAMFGHVVDVGAGKRRGLPATLLYDAIFIAYPHVIYVSLVYA